MNEYPVLQVSNYPFLGARFFFLPVKLQEEENLSFFILDYSSDKIFNTFNEANIVSFINERKRSVVDWCDSFFVFICFYSRLLQTDYQIIEKIEKPQIH